MSLLITQKVNKMLENKKEDVKDLATEAVVASLLPEETIPCKDQDKACTKRWLESLSDCA